MDPFSTLRNFPRPISPEERASARRRAELEPEAEPDPHARRSAFGYQPRPGSSTPCDPYETTYIFECPALQFFARMSLLQGT